MVRIGLTFFCFLAGRGQGANQAMKDGGELAKALLARDMRGVTDSAMLEFSTAFDDAMFKRAFRKYRSVKHVDSH